MRSSLRCAAVALLCLVFVPASGLSQDKFFDSNGVPIRYVEQGVEMQLSCFTATGAPWTPGSIRASCRIWRRITESSLSTPAALGRAGNHTT